MTLFWLWSVIFIRKRDKEKEREREREREREKERERERERGREIRCVCDRGINAFALPRYMECLGLISHKHLIWDSSIIICLLPGSCINIWVALGSEFWGRRDSGFWWFICQLNKKKNAHNVLITHDFENAVLACFFINVLIKTFITLISLHTSYI